MQCRYSIAYFKTFVKEKIGSLPINLNGFSLFSAEHPSSIPLNIAFHAAKIAAPEIADAFLHNLRRHLRLRGLGGRRLLRHAFSRNGE